MSATEIPYLADGTYRVNWAFCRTMKVNGTEGTFHGTNGQNYPASIVFGNFGEADKDIVEKAGAKHFNIQFNLKIGGIRVKIQMFHNTNRTKYNRRRQNTNRTKCKRTKYKHDRIQKNKIQMVKIQM